MTKIYILGTGTPTPTPDRFGSSYVIEVGGEYLMFDCGPAATYKRVKAGLWPTQIDYLFFSHHHFDHDVDYPCFLLCRWDQSIGVENQLKVYGPTLTEMITDRILGEERGAFAHDWKARINSPGSQQVYVNRGGTSPLLLEDLVLLEARPRSPKALQNVAPPDTNFCPKLPRKGVSGWVSRPATGDVCGVPTCSSGGRIFPGERLHHLD